MTAPTKADSLRHRMHYAFGQKRIDDCFRFMVLRSDSVIDLLTDEAREALLQACIRSHKLSRKFAAESRRHHREKQNVV